MVIKDELNIKNRKKKDLIAELTKLKFAPFPNKKKDIVKAVNAMDGEEEEADAPADEAEGSFSYLLSMPLWSLTYERVQAMMKEKNDLEEELKILGQTTVKEMWNKDLDELEAALEDFYDELAQKEAEGEKLSKKGGKGRKRAPAKKKKPADSDDDEDDFGKKVKREVKPKSEPKPKAEAKPKAEPKDEVKPKKEAKPKASKADPKPSKPISSFFKPAVKKEDLEELSLSERLALKSNTKEKRDSLEAITTPPTKKSRSVFDSIDDDDFLATKPKSKADAIDLDDDDEDSKPVKKSRSAPKKSEAAPKKAKEPAKKRITKRRISSESEDEEPEADFSDVETPVKRPRTNGRAAAAAGRKKKIVESDEDSDSDNFIVSDSD